MDIKTKFFQHFDPDFSVVSSSKVFKEAFRLTAEYFRDNTSATFRGDLRFLTLSHFADVSYPGIFKRNYVENAEFGIPFMSSSEMMNYHPLGEGFISKELTRNIESYLVRKNWILVSRSGTIGNVALVTNEMDGGCVTEHALRVIPREIKYMGYLYTYLSSEIGQSEVKGKKSGAVIDEIYEDDLLQLQIPVVDESTIGKIGELIDKAITFREQANEILNEANKLVFEFNSLPALNVSDANFFDTNKIVYSRIVKTSELRLEFRLDAHFYNPIFQLNTEGIYKFAKDVKLLGELCSNIFICYRFPRNFVEEKFGIPLIGTKHTMQIRPTDLKFLPKHEVENDQELIAQKNWILLARVGSLGGTFGKVSFVWENYEGYVASDNIIRIVPNETQIDPAYLFAYLRSNAGYNEIIKLRHGALQDALDVNDIKTVPVPIPDKSEQNYIGNKVRLAFEKRSEAIRLEDEAQDILKKSITQ